MKTDKLIPVLVITLSLLLLPLAGCEEDDGPPPPEPVVADFTASPLSGTAPLIVTFTNLSTGSHTKAVWNFGDGCESTHPAPVHMYVNPGQYTVELTLYDGDEILVTESKPAFIVVDPQNSLPQADFSASPTSVPVGSPVQFLDGSTGDVTTWQWDFGDGSTSSLTNPTHSYAAPATYTVSLTACGPSGSDTEIKTNYITVTSGVPPVANFQGSPTYGLSPLTVTFNDISTGAVTSWSWTFGDGTTGTAQHPTHTYTGAAGTNFSVTLTVTGPGGSNSITRTNYIQIAATAVANFTGTPTSGSSPLAVQFTDASTGVSVPPTGGSIPMPPPWGYTSFSWTFGDGATSTLRNPLHTYNGATGTLYTVSLTVSDSRGSNTLTRTNYISISTSPAQPVADFTGNPTRCPSPLQVTFTDGSRGTVTSWSWNFGDGGSSTLQHPTHTYTGANGTSFTVSLTASGPAGSNTVTKVNYITIGQPLPVPCVPVIYLYPETPRTEDVKVVFKGYATETIPAIPLGREIVWKNCWVDDGLIAYQGNTYDYLFYECVLDESVTSHRGWILQRDCSGRLYLNHREVSYQDLRNHFGNELAEAGLFSHEIADFLECWFGPDEAFFFGKDVFTFAVKYFPIDQVEDTMKIITSWKYHSIVRVQFYIEPATPGLQLLEPVYPVPQTGGSVLHEWGVVPVSTLLEQE